MAERSKAADCKSAGPCPTKVRILLSPPFKAEGRRQKGAGTSAFSLLTSALKGGSNSGVESQPSKLLVAGSNPVSRSKSQKAEGRRQKKGRSRRPLLPSDF